MKNHIAKVSLHHGPCYCTQVRALLHDKHKGRARISFRALGALSTPLCILQVLASRIIRIVPKIRVPFYHYPYIAPVHTYTILLNKSYCKTNIGQWQMASRQKRRTAMCLTTPHDRCCFLHAKKELPYNDRASCRNLHCCIISFCNCIKLAPNCILCISAPTQICR